MYYYSSEEEVAKADTHVRALEDALGDQHSVLRSIVDQCAQEHTAWRKSLGDHEVPKARKAGYRVIPLASIPDRLNARLQSAYHTGGMLLVIAYCGKGETRWRASDKAMAKPFARQFNRLLNLTSTIITDITRDCDNEDVEIQFRLERMQWAFTLSETAVQRLYQPYDREYGRWEATGQYESSRHPDAQKWLRINARCKRKLHDLWLEWARDDEQMAKEMPPFEY